MRSLLALSALALIQTAPAVAEVQGSQATNEHRRAKGCDNQRGWFGRSCNSNHQINNPTWGPAKDAAAGAKLAQGTYVWTQAAAVPAPSPTASIRQGKASDMACVRSTWFFHEVELM